MRIRKSASALLMATLFLSNNFAYAKGLDADTSHNSITGRRQLVKEKSSESPTEALAMGMGIAPSAKKGPGVRLLEKYLRAGNLADGEASLSAELQRHPKDDQTRFGLGVLQFLRAIERLVQDLHRYGVRDLSREGVNLPFLRLPTPPNPNPELLTYAKVRTIFETLTVNFARADATLAPIKDESVKLPLHFGLIKLDLNGDGRAEDNETLWKVYSSLSRETTVTEAQAQSFYIAFDRGDVHWLRGYCNLLSAMCNVFLAYDSHETFECTAHMFFPKVETPYGFLNKGKQVRRFGGSEIDIVDLVSFIHLIRWKVVEPQRMQSALHNLEAMVAQSKDTWKFIMAESDNDREWLPNPNQTAVIPNAKVTQEMVKAWQDLMSVIERLLAGDLLIAFWRDADGRGVNLRKVFMEPPPLDLVLWVQGPAAEPYLERGTTTKIETWRNLQNAFGSQFPGFAVWFN